MRMIMIALVAIFGFGTGASVFCIFGVGVGTLVGAISRLVTVSGVKKSLVSAAPRAFFGESKQT